MLEALLLWQVVGVRRDIRDADRDYSDDPAGIGQGFYTFGVFVRFVATMFLWPFAAAYRTGFFRKAPQAALWTCIAFTIVFGLGALPLYGLIGFFWACFELTAWMMRSEEIR